MDDLFKRLLGLRIFTLPKHDGKFGQYSDLERRLYLIDGIAMGGLPESQAVVRQCAEFVFISRYSGIAVVEVVEGQIPVASASQLCSPYFFGAFDSAHLLSKPSPWVKICTVGDFAAASLGAQNSVAIL